MSGSYKWDQDIFFNELDERLKIHMAQDRMKRKQLKFEFWFKAFQLRIPREDVLAFETQMLERCIKAGCSRSESLDAIRTFMLASWKDL